RHDGFETAPIYSRHMKTSYAVKWREPDGRSYVGRLELGPRALHLVGGVGIASVDRQIGYDELEGLRIGHDAGERLDGRRALVIERPQGAYRLTSTVFEAGILHELVDRLSELSLAAPRRATVVVPLKEGALERARELTATGAPFDAEQLRMGMEVELEHGLHDLLTNVTDDDPLLTAKIALAHLNEFADYYTRLDRMETEAKQPSGDG